MRFVALKSPARQSVLALNRARQGFVKARTAQANRIRGLLGEFGITIPQGLSAIRRRLPETLEEADNELPDALRDVLARLDEHLNTLDQQVQALEADIQQWHQVNAVSRRLAQNPGIGPIRLGGHDRRCPVFSKRPLIGGISRLGAQATQ